MSKQLRITISDGEYEAISPIADRWNRPVSEIALEFFRIGFANGLERYRVMAEAADKWEASISDRPQYRSLAQAIALNWDKLQASRVSPEKLAAIRDGKKKPTELEAARLALALGLTEVELEALPKD